MLYGPDTGPEMNRLSLYVVVLLGVASLCSGQAEVLPGSARATSVAVLALPQSLGPISSTHDTRHLAHTIAAALRSASFTVLVAGVTDGVPLEELNARANTHLVDVALGVWDVAGSTQCPAVLAPVRVSPPEPPETFTLPRDDAALDRHVRELAASSRSKASARLATALASVGSWCDRAPNEAEAYLLEGTQMPTVVIAAAPSDEASLADRIPAILEEWLDAERSGGRTTKR